MSLDLVNNINIVVGIYGVLFSIWIARSQNKLSTSQSKALQKSIEDKKEFKDNTELLTLNMKYWHIYTITRNLWMTYLTDAQKTKVNLAEVVLNDNLPILFKLHEQEKTNECKDTIELIRSNFFRADTLLNEVITEIKENNEKHIQKQINEKNNTNANKHNNTSTDI